MPYKDPAQRKAYMKRYLERWRQENPDYFTEWNRRNKDKRKVLQRRYLSNPENRKKRNARNLVAYALRQGKIIKPEQCESCSSEKRIEAHHDDYNQPLSVRWLCKKCHVSCTLVV